MSWSSPEAPLQRSGQFTSAGQKGLGLGVAQGGVLLGLCGVPRGRDGPAGGADSGVAALPSQLSLTLAVVTSHRLTRCHDSDLCVSLAHQPGAAFGGALSGKRVWQAKPCASQLPPPPGTWASTRLAVWDAPARSGPFGPAPRPPGCSTRPRVPSCVSPSRRLRTPAMLVGGPGPICSKLMTSGGSRSQRVQQPAPP